jgi:hypothetical protein
MTKCKILYIYCTTLQLRTKFTKNQAYISVKKAGFFFLQKYYCIVQLHFSQHMWHQFINLLNVYDVYVYVINYVTPQHYITFIGQVFINR